MIRNGSCFLLRREALDRAGWFDAGLPACVDTDLCLRVAGLRPGNVVAIPEVRTFRRRRRGQVSSDWRRQEAGYLQLMERLRKSGLPELRREENRSRAGRYRYYARLALEAGEAGPSARLLAIAFCWAPGWLLADPGTWLLGLSVVCHLLLPRGWSLRVVRSGRRLLGTRRS